LLDDASLILRYHTSFLLSSLSKEEAGLPKDLKVKTNQIRSIDRERLIKRLNNISGERLKEIEQSLLTHLGIA